jgi:nicotinamidase-related amidase
MPPGTSRAALLIMDTQQVIVDRLPPQAGADAGLRQIALAAGLARESGIPVIYPVIAFREGHPEVGRHNKLLAAAKENAFLLESDQVTAVHPAVRPRDGDIVVLKRRVDSFFGSDLEIVLRAQQADTLLLAGFTTSGVVLATFLSAVDRDFGVTVLADCCVDRDPELHELLITRLFPQRASVQTVPEWSDSLRAARAGRGTG